MKHTLLIAFALLASFVSAAPSHNRHGETRTVILVIAYNPSLPGGALVTTSLVLAEEEVFAMISLNPICNAVPQACASIADATYYRVFYSDGSESII